MLIDLVYAWVDGSCPVHQSQKNLYGDDLFLRWRCNEELRYSLRSVATYAPWVNKIHIVTNGQRPYWLKESSRIQIVEHGRIYKNKDHLPTFNSLSIETNIHRIPGLAEHFIYSNDDMMLLKPVEVSDFYTKNGRMRMGYRDESLEELWVKLMFPDIKVRFSDHQMNPFTKEIYAEAERLWPDEFEATSATKFRVKERSYTSIPLNEYLLLNLAVATRRAFWIKRDAMYVTKGNHEGYQNIIDQRPTFWCLNDQGGSDEGLSKFLKTLYPTPSPFEL